VVKGRAGPLLRRKVKDDPRLGAGDLRKYSTHNAYIERSCPITGKTRGKKIDWDPGGWKLLGGGAKEKASGNRARIQGDLCQIANGDNRVPLKQGRRGKKALRKKRPKGENEGIKRDPKKQKKTAASSKFQKH